MGGSAPGTAWPGHLIWGSFVPDVSYLPPWNSWPAWIVLIVTSEEQESKQKHAGKHTKHFQTSALAMSANILLTKANYMVKHRISG